jgi:hypothetical protein
LHLAPYLVLLPLMRWKNSLKSFNASEVHARVLRLHPCGYVRVVDVILVLYLGPCGGVDITVVVLS